MVRSGRIRNMDSGTTLVCRLHVDLRRQASSICAR
ncbi:putative leader peptide [Kitasatospora sp. NPDC097643]